MNEAVIRFRNIEDITRFVNIVDTYSDFVQLTCGEYIINGKSIIGIISYGLNKDVLMKIHGNQRDIILKRTAFCQIP